MGESSAGQAEGQNELTCLCARFVGKGVGGTRERAGVHASKREGGRGLLVGQADRKTNVAHSFSRFAGNRLGGAWGCSRVGQVAAERGETGTRPSGKGGDRQ